MKVLIVYDSVFGNTEEIAKAIADTSSEKDIISIINVSEFSIEKLSEVNLLIVGSPTRGFRPTKPISDFLKSLPSEKVKDVKAAAFDTRIDLATIKNRFFRYLVDNKYASKPIAKMLTAKGATLIVQPEGFLVSGEQGPLKDGEIKRASEWGRKCLMFN